MSVVENRSNSALFKRAEQLKRWEESETNRELHAPKIKSRRIQFSLECVFLAACASGDKDEVLRLLSIGADIDTSNVDGLSALHQACIDDNLDMVEFLVEHGADINKGDNEGWTPLHATASCGFISIAKYLIEHGADVASVNNDGELAVDIAESDEMEDLLHAVLKERGIDSDEARNKEERLMLQHAKEWLSSGKFEDIPHEKTGATALHVAASKGYIKVMDTLIQAGADVNAQDFDGWTPLHAAAHWGQKEACEILVENFCDMDLKNYVGQSAFDVSEGEMTRLLEDLKKKRLALQKEKSEKNVIKGMPWLNNTDKLDILLKDKDSTLKRQSYGQFIMEEDVCPMDKVPKVEIKLETEFADTKMRTNIADENNKYIHLNDDEKQKIPRLPDTINKVPINSVPSTSPPKSVNENEDSRVPSWRKTVSLRNVIRPPFKFDEDKQWTSASNDQVNINSDDKTPEVALRRTQSFEADDKFYRRYCELKAKIESGNARPALISPANNTASLPMRSASLKEKYNRKALLMHEDVLPSSPTLTPSSTSTTASPAQPLQDTSAAILLPPKSTSVRNGIKSAVNAAEATTVSAPTTPIASKLSPGNIFKNFFKSFVPPVRDEESETQRKAHAKRVRETRRSTQGVTLEELKSAEQLVKKKQQQQQLQQATSQLHSSSPIVEQPKSTDPRKQTWSSKEPANLSVSATIHTGTTTVPLSHKSAATNERRPSWRLRIDNGCKFMLEDARNSDRDTESPNDVASPGWPGAQTIGEPSSPDTANVTLPFRKNNNNLFTEELDQQTKSDKEKNFSLTQPVNPRRKRSKRRSTGAVQIDAEELNERLNSENEVNDTDNVESGGTDRSGRTSRLGSTSSLGDNESSSRPTTPGLPNENGVLDYKKLYEETLSENELLRNKLKKAEDELTQCKSRLTDPPAPVINKNSLSELEKREKRAMERKLSEMEEELKNIEQIKQENQRLKDENGALIRVISKLSK